VAKKTKMVAQLMTITGFTRVKVLQLGGRLADQQLVHETKRDGQTPMRKTAISRPRSRLVTSLPIPTGIRDSDQAGRLARSRRQMAVVRMRARQRNFLRATGAKAPGGSLPVEANKLAGINRLPVWCADRRLF